MATANSKRAVKGKPRGKPFPKGVSGNPAGRPKDGESWSGIIKAVGDMYSDDLIAFIGKDNDLGRALAQFPKNVQLKYLVVARVFAAQMFEPNGLFNSLLDRLEGKVTEKFQFENALQVDGLEQMMSKVYGNRDNSG